MLFCQTQPETVDALQKRNDVMRKCSCSAFSGIVVFRFDLLFMVDFLKVADDSWKGSLQFDWLKKMVDVLIRKGGTR